MILSNFTHQYSLSKTLRFELKPMAQTLMHVQSKGFLDQDEHLASAYKQIKVLLDDYHRDFIEKALSGVSLPALDECVEAYELAKQNSKDEKIKANLTKAQEKLRKQIVKNFEKDKLTAERFKGLFAKDLFIGPKNSHGHLATWLIEHYGENDPRLQIIEQFRKFTTYFGGFHKNRRNMYTDEEHQTAIAYRLVHENLPRFLDNRRILDRIRQQYPDLYQELSGLDERVLQGLTIEQLLEVDFYTNLLAQPGITSYNTVLGGISQEDQTKLQGINEKINLYNQSHKIRLPRLKPLYKQILSDRQGLSFLPPKFVDDAEVCEAVNDFYRHHQSTMQALYNLVSRIQEYHADGLYVSHDQLNRLSKAVFGDFGRLSYALDYYYVNKVDPKFNQKLAKAKSDDAKEKLVKLQDKFIKSEHSLAALQEMIALLPYREEAPVKGDALVQYFARFTGVGAESLLETVDNKYSKIKATEFLERDRKPGEAVLHKHKNSDDVKNLKAFLDSILAVVHFVKPLALPKNTALMVDESFYGEFSRLYDELSLFSRLYNKVRDYISQKPYSVEKYKLNFGNATLLHGWDVNKEKDNFGIILRKDDLYYLAILDTRHKKVFDKLPKATSKNVYQKMVYKLLPGPNKMLPKVFFAKGNLDYYRPSAELLEKYAQGTHKKGENFNLQDCHDLIDFFKSSIDKHPEWQNFGFKFSDTKSYSDLSSFYKEVEPQGYHVKFMDIDADYIDDLVAEGKLYLFQIYNKDFSPNSYGKKNLHTLYFTELFSPQNLDKPVYKLNGEAEVFYRRASLRLEDVAIHKAGELLSPKNLSTKNQQGRKLGHDVIKNKRYTQDKFLLHVPITLNFGLGDIGPRAFNKQVNETLQQADKTCVIGIDRGERHLLYVSVVDEQGRLLEQPISLNAIDVRDHQGQTVAHMDYQKLLDEKEKDRAQARLNWGSIENIKDLKSGYLSQVVNSIILLLRKYIELGYVPVITLEDLNFGFKRGRFKVEKQVYQNFENALIKKLNYLVFKDKYPDEIGGIRQALQLVNKFENISDVGKQTGFIFYVPAWNTSKIDPATGFVDLLKPRYENITQSQDFFGRFDYIGYNAERDYFEFQLDYEKFTDKAAGSRTAWTICSHGDTRYVYDKNANQGKGNTIAINVNDQLKSLFDQHPIDYRSNKNLVDAISQSNQKSLHSGLTYLLRVLLAMRYSNSSTKEDFILSPVADLSGEFFDSRLASVDEPQDADANGAYHIALKGLMLLEQIRQSDDLDKLKPDLSNKQWLQYAQKRTK